MQAGDTVGRYRLESRLAGGGQGSVFLAVDERGYQYALKLIHGDSVRGAKEVEAAKAVRSPHVARVWAHDLTPPDPYIAYAAVPGHPLGEVLSRRELSVAELLYIFRDVASGLADIHAVSTDRIPQLSHGDISLDNIMVTDANEAVIIDLGAARFGFDSSVSRDMFGKFGYFAPEQWRGAPGGPPADMWAFGVAVVRAATGHMPFGNGPESMKRALDERPNIEDLPVPLAGVVAACLRKDPEERWTADRIVKRLEREISDIKRYPERWARVQRVEAVRFAVNGNGLLVREVQLFYAEQGRRDDRWFIVRGRPSPGDFTLVHRGMLIAPPVFASAAEGDPLPVECPACGAQLRELEGNWRVPAYRVRESLGRYCPSLDCQPQRRFLIDAAAKWAGLAGVPRPILGYSFDCRPLIEAVKDSDATVVDFLGLTHSQARRFVDVTDDDWLFITRRRRPKHLFPLDPFLRLFGYPGFYYYDDGSGVQGRLTMQGLAKAKALPPQFAAGDRGAELQLVTDWWAERGDLVCRAADAVARWRNE